MMEKKNYRKEKNRKNRMMKLGKENGKMKWWNDGIIK